jgi:hypothetical protein
MSQQVQPEKVAVRKSVRATATSREAVRQSNARLRALSTEPVTTGSIPTAPPPENNRQLLFTKEWYAREEAIDARLRQRLNICSGC